MLNLKTALLPSRTQKSVPKSPALKKLESKAEDAGCRPDVAFQIHSMARLNGLTSQDLTERPWITNWLVENCNRCPFGETCFKDKRGRQAKASGINNKNCPNVENFDDLREYKRKRNISLAS